MIIVGLYVLFRRVLPLMYAAFARGNHLSEWTILSLTAFFLFLWGSRNTCGILCLPRPPVDVWSPGVCGILPGFGRMQSKQTLIAATELKRYRFYS